MLFELMKESAWWFVGTIPLSILGSLAIRAMYVRWLHHEPRPMLWRHRIMAWPLFFVLWLWSAYYTYHAGFPMALDVGLIGAVHSAICAELGVLILHRNRLDQIGWMYGFLFSLMGSTQWLHDLSRQFR